MILVDFNQVLLGNLFSQVNPKDTEINDDLIRHLVLNSILNYRQLFTKEYGEMVLCVDYGKHYWRKDIFPFYKASRKKSREKSDYDWDMIYETLNKIRNEIKENFPYKVLEVKLAEADDIIATLCKYTQKNELASTGIIEEPQKVLIISSDKDFMQLQKYKNVNQYSPVRKRMISEDNPDIFLKEHILRGDSSDGIPNFLSPDNVFVDPDLKQNRLYQKKIDIYIDQNPEEFCDENQLKNYYRNKTLIDLDEIPKTVENDIIETYKSTDPSSRRDLYKYFMNNKLMYLIDFIGDF